MKKVCGIYQIRNIINNKKYVGQSKDIWRRIRSHCSSLKSNKHDSSYLQNAWNTYGETCFEFSVLLIAPYEQLDDLEREIICELDLLNRDCGYNLENGGMRGKHISDNTIAGLRLAKVGKPLSAQHKENLVAAWKIRKLTPFSEQTRNKMSKSKKGHIVTKETREKLSKTKKGKSQPPRSQETKDKIRKTMSGLVRGPMSEEAKHNLSESKKRQWESGTSNLIQDAFGRFKRKEVDNE